MLFSPIKTLMNTQQNSKLAYSVKRKEKHSDTHLVKKKKTQKHTDTYKQNR